MDKQSVCARLTADSRRRSVPHCWVRNIQPNNEAESHTTDPRPCSYCSSYRLPLASWTHNFFPYQPSGSSSRPVCHHEKHQKDPGIHPLLLFTLLSHLHFPSSWPARILRAPSKKPAARSRARIMLTVHRRLPITPSLLLPVRHLPQLVFLPLPIPHLPVQRRLQIPFTVPRRPVQP